MDTLPMRTSLVVCSLVLGAVVDGTAFAQSNPTPQSSAETQAIEERVADWLKQCLDDWDKATHMTKDEWRATCHRVAGERGKFLRENPERKRTDGQQR
jgi:hypothetical protein